MSVFETNYTVVTSNIDELNHVNNVVYLQWIQDIAGLHWNELKQGVDTAAYVWVVIRHEIDYLNQALLGDTLLAKTWVGKTAGLKSIRHVEFYRNNKLLVKAQTTFCLLHAKSFKPMRITDEILAMLAPK
ncbi:acyl-CoA thioesterase [Flavobacteriaceae bacterium]|jgi:acyl-CoA thioester hydrolase|nr:acyl-CoA thioesterase [Flavobacterium sp.]MBT7425802.1 acyl-CoA thioesterase [Flavobacterium sp.]MDB2556275.1 acyl-CoA thioesterase [Flavobacteriaceae bacterium]MDC3299276.1 acyl-CoA thioesterase [Flavobacteriaceae bacterium]